MGDHRGNSADDGRDDPADDGAGDGADHRGDDTAHNRGGDNTVRVGGDNRGVDSGGVDKRVSLSLGLGLSLTLAVVVTVDRVKSRVDTRVDGRGSVVDGRVDSRGGNVVDGRGGSVDSTVANGANTRDKAVAVVDSGDDSTGSQTMGNLPNGVSLGISLSLGGSHKQNKNEGPHDLSRLVLSENWSPC